MGLFDFFKKKKEEKAEEPCCCCRGEEKAEEACCCGAEERGENCCCGEPVNGVCCVKVLGACCNACHKQHEYAKEAVKILGLDVEVEQIEDMAQIMDYGALSLPAVVVNDKVICKGKAVRTEELIKLMKKHGFCE